LSEINCSPGVRVLRNQLKPHSGDFSDGASASTTSPKKRGRAPRSYFCLYFLNSFFCRISNWKITLYFFGCFYFRIFSSIGRGTKNGNYRQWGGQIKKGRKDWKGIV